MTTEVSKADATELSTRRAHPERSPPRGRLLTSPRHRVRVIRP